MTVCKYVPMVLVCICHWALMHVLSVYVHLQCCLENLLCFTWSIMRCGYCTCVHSKRCHMHHRCVSCKSCYQSKDKVNVIRPLEWTSQRERWSSCHPAVGCQFDISFIFLFIPLQLNYLIEWQQYHNYKWLFRALVMVFVLCLWPQFCLSHINQI